MRRLVSAVLTSIVCGACGGVPPQAIRDWARPTFPQYRTLIDEKYESADTRANGYSAMASLICTADTADKKPDSVACKCHKATSDTEKTQQCAAFMSEYPAPNP